VSEILRGSPDPVVVEEDGSSSAEEDAPSLLSLVAVVAAVLEQLLESFMRTAAGRPQQIRIEGKCAKNKNY
jgi:hypothetical protein